jgi:syntaxin 16
LKEIIQELRRNEKEHFIKVQEIHGEDLVGSKSKKDLDRFLNDDE